MSILQEEEPLIPVCVYRGVESRAKRKEEATSKVKSFGGKGYNWSSLC